MDISVLALTIFLATYILIAARQFKFLHIGRPAGALLGAAAMVASGVVPIKRAFASIDLATIGLLFGMMVISEYLRTAGFFRALTEKLSRRTSSPSAFLTAVVWISGIGSAFLVNDPVCIMMTPIVLAYAALSERDPLPFLIALATSSNIGSMATLAGNPQNMLIAGESGLSYARYAMAVFPLALILLLLNNFLLLRVYGKRFGEGLPGAIEMKEVRVKKSLLLKSLIVLVSVVSAWFMGVDLAFVAIAGAVAIILLARISPERIFARLDWTILVFFAALFVVVDAVEYTGALENFFSFIPKDLGLGGSFMFGLASVLLSNLFSNVPFVMVAVKWAGSSTDPGFFYYLLAVTSTLAGNLTLIGSMANLIVVEMARGARVVGFREYLRYGLLITFVTTIFSTVYLFQVFKVLNFKP